MDIMLISGNPNKVPEFRGKVYNGLEILDTMGLVASEGKVEGWNCIMSNAEVMLVPKAFFEEEFGQRIIVGVE